MKNFKKTLNNFFLALVMISMTITTSCTKENFPVLVAPDPTSVTDVDGNVYPVAKICDKFWMLENLRTTKYNDGTIIPTGLSNTEWGNTTIGAYSVYGDVTTNNLTYGKLYNWYAGNNTKLAPTGWHVATENEWIALVECLGGSSIAGGKMKSTSSLWTSPNTGADNSSGFNGLPAGWKAGSGSYALLGDAAYFWGSNERNTTQGEYLKLVNNMTSVALNGATKSFGYSIRCVKD